ncbi:hypothetical protein D9M68_452980 [compost metagenome]
MTRRRGRGLRQVALGARGAARFAEHQPLGRAARQAHAHAVQQVALGPGLAFHVAVVAALERGHVDADLLRRAAEEQGVHQAVAGLVHREQRTEVGVGALLEPVQLQRHRELAPRQPEARDQARAAGRDLAGVEHQPHGLAAVRALFERPQRGIDQRRAQDRVDRREQRARALRREHGVGVDLLVHARVEHEAHARAFLDLAHVAVADRQDQAHVGGAAERRVDHVVVAQPRDLLGLEAFGQRLLHVDERELLRQRVEDVGVGVAVFHPLGGLGVHLVEVARDEDQQLGVVGFPVVLRGAEGAQPRLDLVGLPGHDFEQRLAQLQAALELLRFPGRELQAALALGLASLGAVVLFVFIVVIGAAVLVVLGPGQRRLDLAEHRQRRRQAAVREQRPHVLVALHARFLAAGVHGAKALELVEHEDAGRALGDARLGQHGRDRTPAAVARAVAEAVHLHFDEAVVKAQVLRQAPHELRLAGAGQAPQADDDRAADELRQHVPGAQRIDHAIDDLVDAEQLGLQRMGNGLQVARALGQRGVQVAGNVLLRHEVLFLRMIRDTETGMRPLLHARCGEGGGAGAVRVRLARFSP